ncbi:MAG: class I SAM-dependent methyltransferase [Gemmatimonadaceae bacterium]|jgi:SAM-dependent methyltransferase|nr:class I SAM-dependent methyltransferase [Gemmatimonadaceae bacterium]
MSRATPVSSAATRPPEFAVDRLRAADAIVEAQRIAFAPFVFQATVALRRTGILAACDVPDGASEATIVAATGLADYGARVLLEAGLGIGLLVRNGGSYTLTRTGWFVLHDRMTIANLDFSHDVCYRGLFDLEAAVREGRPAGLHTLGDWATVYEGLTTLPTDVRGAWDRFDHFYSDDAFPLALDIVARHAPRSILDIGCNTGRFARQCLARDAVPRVGLVDLPAMARATHAALVAEGLGDRVTAHPANLLDPAVELPRGYDAAWMSQFLDCFAEDEIVHILRTVRRALPVGAPVFIMEPFWDRQKREVSAFCLQMTSLYFTAIANGNSRMYESDRFIALVERAGLVVDEQHDQLGVCQTLLVCRA